MNAPSEVKDDAYESGAQGRDSTERERVDAWVEQDQLKRGDWMERKMQGKVATIKGQQKRSRTSMASVVGGSGG
ncbi:hypothetical protein EMCG_06958 [[Emmonsia] crescens]|uniref:Uncharacterized protein n=1 Tax=[Emmonsia] crescens TaxID=73230 RepID=A0A0G2IAT1_9EURO|nr:hypothetical protein EMCG_06958 [Emmonsia crescens UAMH 3008]